MPGLDGIGLVAKLKELKLHFPAIVITGHGDIRTAVNALKAGAEDFLEKPFTSEALLNVVQRLKQTIHSADLDAGTAAKRLSNLTGRERDVLHRLMAGMPNKIIAHDLTISIRTVEFYRTRVMKKLRVKSLSEMIRLALTAGVEIDLSKAQRPRF
jgi:two-component system response regulator FixJ